MTTKRKVALIALLLLGAAYYVVDRDAAVHAALMDELRAYQVEPRAESEPAPEEHTSPPGEHVPST